MLRAVTPGGHPLITGLWLAGLAGLGIAVGGAVAVSAGPLVVGLACVAAALLVAGFVAYQLRLRRFSATLVAAEEALDAGELERARDLVAPLFARFPTFPLVQEVAADVLYAAGDPLSAASLWEGAMKRLGGARIAPRLVAAYAALNRGGDARRVAALAPDDPSTRLAITWSELVATGGDRERGAALADGIARDRSLSVTPSSEAMASAIVAIAAARRGDRSATVAAIEAAQRVRQRLRAHDAAFVGYLVAVALRELGDVADARAVFTSALDSAPDSIGGALARRERSHLLVV
ncbi:MAG TPA: hypothetical protein VGQ86_10455 [Candidatus Limnocylindria bacterium]|nr:hypothetical protein [Candidatus Limnocylindria bacterium]